MTQNILIGSSSYNRLPKRVPGVTVRRKGNVIPMHEDVGGYQGNTNPGGPITYGPNTSGAFGGHDIVRPYASGQHPNFGSEPSIKVPARTKYDVTDAEKFLHHWKVPEGKTEADIFGTVMVTYTDEETVYNSMVLPLQEAIAEIERINDSTFVSSSRTIEFVTSNGALMFLKADQVRATGIRMLVKEDNRGGYKAVLPVRRELPKP
jgi:hypothetical protein